MKILISGSAGFIGFHAVKKFLELGHEVVGIDNINDYYDTNLKESRLQQISSTRFKFIKADFADNIAVKKVFNDHVFDRVLHLGAQAGVRHSITNPNDYVNSNLVGFVNILEAVRHAKVPHLVYASSSSVYGMNKNIPFSENDKVDHPISLYAATKKSNELMAHTYSHLYNIPTTGLRFFTVYGPWGRPDMAYFLFTKAILDGKEINIFNNGKMERDFTYIDDVINGIIKIIDQPPSINSNPPSDSQNTSAPYKIYNIGNNKPENLLYFIEIIEKCLGKKTKKNFLPMQPGDVVRTYANIDNLYDEIGYKPITPIEEGLEKFVEWYKKYYN
jgi:UDP-glucuronate 4-epimerase